jgi:hypothetical protein
MRRQIGKATLVPVDPRRPAAAIGRRVAAAGERRGRPRAGHRALHPAVLTIRVDESLYFANAFQL